MKYTKGSTLIATGTIITGLLTIITGFVAYNFKDKVNAIATVQASVNKIEIDVIPDLRERTSLNEKDITYIKSAVDDIKASNKEILKALK